MNPLITIWRTKELRNGFLLILLAVTVFRLAAHIPVPGIDASGLQALLAQNQFLGMLNVFAGGTLEGFSIVAMGVAPYITASIIIQLLGMIFPSVEEMQKEEQGRQKLNRYTRFLTVPLAIFQAYGLMRILQSQGGLVSVPTLATDPVALVATLLAMAAGTVFLMWLGELISEQKLGNGMSIMIFAGIISGLPSLVGNTIQTYTPADLLDIIMVLVLGLVMVVAVVAISEAQRNIPVQYARGQAGGANIPSTLPLRVNMGGMIPIIFAMSMLVLPPLVAQYLVTARSIWLQQAATEVLVLFGNRLVYGAVFFLLVFGFTFFYASVVFKPEQVAENLQKQGGFVVGVRPGEATALYLQKVVNRILLLGAVFLATIAVLPIGVQELTGNANLVVGGSSVIIVVSVILDIVKQVQAQLSMRAYESHLG
jgi:preprotein translocase subunit SecY